MGFSSRIALTSSIAGEDVLLQFAEYLRKGEKDEKKHERMCLDFSNKWWSLLHTTRPFVMTLLSQLAEVVSIKCILFFTYAFAIHNLLYFY